MSSPLTVGTDVVSADGEKVGEIVAVHPAYVIVERGLRFPSDTYVPRSALRESDSDRTTLIVTKEEALRLRWESPRARVDRDAETAVFPSGEPVRLDADEDSV